MCCLFTLRKTNTSRLSHSKNCNKSLKCLFFSVWTDNTFYHAKFITIFRMGKPWSVCFSQCEQTTHFLMLNLLQFLEWGNLEVFVFLSVNRHLHEKMCCLFTLRKTNTSRLSHSKNCNKSSMRKCVVCSHWEKQTLQGYPILKIVINLVWENVCSHSHAKFITIFRMG
jgi:hypothetical protein